MRKNANDQPFDEVKIFKRLMELKELYEIQRRELGLPVSSLPFAKLMYLKLAKQRFQAYQNST